MLLSFVMVVESFEVEHILVQFILSLLYSLLFFSNLIIACLLEFFVLIALIVSSRLLTMLFPVTQAEPTKLKRAKLACHVVATLVFLDWPVTLRARLGVRHNPGNVLTFRRILRLPLYRCLAGARPVRLLAALEAKRVATLALDITDTILLVLDAVVTALVWAPSHVLVVICVGLTEPFHICL